MVEYKTCLDNNSLRVLLVPRQVKYDLGNKNRIKMSATFARNSISLSLEMIKS